MMALSSTLVRQKTPPKEIQDNDWVRGNVCSGCLQRHDTISDGMHAFIPLHQLFKNLLALDGSKVVDKAVYARNDQVHSTSYLIVSVNLM